MFKCEIVVFLPLRKVGQESSLSFTIAEYEFDPGLAPGDVVNVNNASFIQTIRNGERVAGNDPKFSFEAQVLRRRKIIEPGVAKDSFLLLIDLEIANKELIPEIVKLCKDTFPGEYEDYEVTKSTQD